MPGHAHDLRPTTDGEDLRALQAALNWPDDLLDRVVEVEICRECGHWGDVVLKSEEETGATVTRPVAELLEDVEHPVEG